MRPGTEYRWRDKDGREHTLLPDAGWSYNPGRQPFGPRGDDPGQLDNIVAGQKPWTAYGGLDETLPSQPPPPRLPAAATPEDAADTVRRGVAEAGGVITEDGSFRIPTPPRLPGGDVVITADSVAHIIQKRDQERERLARYIVPALANPAEVWLQAQLGHQGRPVYRRIFVSRFDDLDAAVVVEEIPKSADFTVTFYPADDIGRRRQGYLLYRQEEG